MMLPLFTATGAFLAGLAVLLGGLRTHVLRNRIPAERLTLLDVGTRYQLFHALALIVLGSVWIDQATQALLVASGFCFLLGTLLFPGVLYLFTFTGKAYWLRVSMIGGAFYVIAWSLLGIAALR